ncbi:CopG family transcriptional regulator [Microbacterium sp. NPDC089320]|uniref:CopG family transcriptional regulator n=1 Tax=Microbacterium sp. NPDC089320 TaxID=3155182 RepID=UPI00341D4CBA
MKTAISVPDGDFARFERVAARHGMNRSEFFQLAGRRLADELEGTSDLTRIANQILAQAEIDPADAVFVRANEQRLRESTDW